MPETTIVASDANEWPEWRLMACENVSPQEAFEPALAGHLIVIHATPEPVRVFERADGYQGAGVALPGHINLFSAGDMSYCSWDKELTFLRLDLSTGLTGKVAAELELAAGSSADFGRHIRLSDDRVGQLGSWLLEDTRSGGMGGKLYTDSLIRMLTVHLLHRYGTASRRKAAVPNKLAPKQLDQALSYIHAYLERDIGLGDIAAAAHVSPSHLVRLFKEATGLPPHQYVIRERIRRAQRLLLGGQSIQEVSMALGFSDQSHFQRHFKRIAGLTPRQFVIQFK